MTDYIDFKNPHTGRVAHTREGSPTYKRAMDEGWTRLTTKADVVEVRKDIIAAQPAPEPVIEPMVEPVVTQDDQVADSWIVAEPVYDVDRPRRDPYAFSDVDPEYAEQIELRQEVQQLGRAVQAGVPVEERLEEKYDEYIEVREERGAVVPSEEIQYRATHPRSAEELRALQPVVAPPVVSPEPVVSGLNFRADSGIRKLLFLGIVAGIAKALLRD